MQKLLSDIRDCTVCAKHLPMGPRPILEASLASKIVLIGQAPGRVVHESGKAWADQSGKKLRDWLGVDEAAFYNTDNFAILPMAFCYPGKAKTGDLSPRRECAPMWHDAVLEQCKNVALVVLIGSYASSYYLPKDGKNLTQHVESFEDFSPKYWPIPHPSPTNRFWKAKNPWFEERVVPLLQKRVAEILEVPNPRLS